MTNDHYRIGAKLLRPGRDLADERGPVPIGGRALSLLTMLAQAGGRTLTKDDLLTACWPGMIVEENALQAQISAARKALGEDAARLVTVHGRGYRLDCGGIAAPAPRQAEDASVAVLPFDNLTGNADHAYLADGLAEELIFRLHKVPGLKVPSRTSSFGFRGRGMTVREIAAALGVAHVLEGSVRAGTERLRVGAQLVDAGSGFTVWSETFDRTLGDLLDLQDELAAAIAGALRRELGPRLRETHSSEAMRLVLQARAASRALTRQGLEEAIRLARSAVALDPAFARAWESLAGSMLMAGITGFAGFDAFAEARSLAEQALTLDPTVAGARGIVAGVEAACGRLVEAAEQFERAFESDPRNLPAGGHAISNLYLPTGLTTRATHLAEQGIALAPERADGYAICALCASNRGDMAEARRLLDAALLRGHPPTRPGVLAIEAELALLAGDFHAAGRRHATLAAQELALPGAGPAMEAVFAALAGEADPVAASTDLDMLLVAAERSGTLWRHTGNVAIFIHWQARLGMLDAAFAAAARIAPHWRSSGRMMAGSLVPIWSPRMAAFRRDPRFQEMVRDLELIRFWERHGPPDGHVLEGDRLIVATAQ